MSTEKREEQSELEELATWPEEPTVEPAGDVHGGRIIRIVNLRASASQVGMSATPIPSR